MKDGVACIKKRVGPQLNSNWTSFAGIFKGFAIVVSHYVFEIWLKIIKKYVVLRIH